MTTSLLPFRPVVVRACTISGHRKPDGGRKSPSSSNWWTPLFGWPSTPDYIDSDNNVGRCKNGCVQPVKEECKSVSDLTRKTARSRFAPGCFTEEKARQLRLMTMDTSFHDAMYHSAIASRLASDFSDRSDR